MKIVKEYYRDFIGVLAHKRAELNTEIKALEHAFKREDYDECDRYEYASLKNDFHYYTKIQTFFMETERWTEFANLETLSLYTQVIEQNYNAITEYSKAILPVDGGETIGVTQKEWNEIETARYTLRETMVAWLAFIEFCEHAHMNKEVA